MTPARHVLWRPMVSALVGTALLAGCGAAAGDPGVAVPRSGPTSGASDGAGTTPAPVPAADAAGQVPLAQQAGTPDSQTYPVAPGELVLPWGDVAPVDPAGVDGTGVLEVPEDPSRVGWWNGGARAGDPFGGIVLAGHVDSREFGLGVLAPLRDVALGTEVVLADGGSGFRYEVESVTSVPKARLAEGTDVFRQDGPHRLVLITCGGEFDRATRSYADNVVVVATFVGPA